MIPKNEHMYFEYMHINRNFTWVKRSYLSTFWFCSLIHRSFRESLITCKASWIYMPYMPSYIIMYFIRMNIDKFFCISDLTLCCVSNACSIISTYKKLKKVFLVLALPFIVFTLKLLTGIHMFCLFFRPFCLQNICNI